MVIEGGDDFSDGPIGFKASLSLTLTQSFTLSLSLTLSLTLNRWLSGWWVIECGLWFVEGLSWFSGYLTLTLTLNLTLTLTLLPHTHPKDSFTNFGFDSHFKADTDLNAL